MVRPSTKQSNETGFLAPKEWRLKPVFLVSQVYKTGIISVQVKRACWKWQDKIRVFLSLIFVYLNMPQCMMNDAVNNLSHLLVSRDEMVQNFVIFSQAQRNENNWKKKRKKNIIKQNTIFSKNVFFSEFIFSMSSSISRITSIPTVPGFFFFFHSLSPRLGFFSHEVFTMATVMEV